VDEDCSGAADEDYASQATACGVGACASTGATSCVSGSVQDSCTPGAPAASDATCDGVDQDCSGTSDEDYASQATACGVGACASTGATSCVAGSVRDSCTPGNPAPDDACGNGRDDDCDGTVDEDCGGCSDPPAFEVVLNPQVLSPANGSLRRVVADIRVTSACSAPVTVVLDSITSNVASDGIVEAEVGTPDTSFLLRAQSATARTVRIYRVTYRATDGSGRSSSVTTDVMAPPRR
jgi:hypothetical protein